MGPRHAHDDVDLRRRCVAYDQWLAHHPDRMSFVEMWADQNFEMISGLCPRREGPNLPASRPRRPRW
jgi:hypothetical protein